MEDYTFVTDPFSSTSSPLFLSRSSSPLSLVSFSLSSTPASQESSQESWVHEEVIFFDIYDHYLEDLQHFEIPMEEEEEEEEEEEADAEEEAEILLEKARKEGKGLLFRPDGFIYLSHPNDFLLMNRNESQLFEVDPIRIELPSMFEDFDPNGPKPCVPPVCKRNYKAALMKPVEPPKAQLYPTSQTIHFDAAMNSLFRTLWKHNQQLSSLAKRKKLPAWKKRLPESHFNFLNHEEEEKEEEKEEEEEELDEVDELEEDAHFSDDDDEQLF